ncbi:MAG: TlpA family protein disulfide reductase [Candidatus Methylacidiphilales bacterium]
MKTWLITEWGNRLGRGLQVLLVCVAVCACSDTLKEPPPRSINPFPLPDFELPTPDGKTIRSETLRGTITLITFWSTWAPSSIRQGEDLQRVQSRFPDVKIALLGIALSTDEDHGDIQSFLEHGNVDFPIVIAPRSFHHRFQGIEAVPTTFVVDTSGMVVNRYTGVAVPSELDRELRYLIAKERRDNEAK